MLSINLLAQCYMSLVSAIITQNYLSSLMLLFLDLYILSYCFASEFLDVRKYASQNYGHIHF